MTSLTELLEEMKKRAIESRTMRDYEGNSRLTDSCVDPSVCVAKRDVPRLIAALEYIYDEVLWEDTDCVHYRKITKILTGESNNE